MADEHGAPPGSLIWLERLASEPGAFGFHAVLRRFDAGSSVAPRLGDSEHPADEGIRIGQVPSSSFEPDEVSHFTASEAGAPARLSVSFLGLWGPNGPLPAHMTEYARDRLRHAGDATLARFADIFHHRMLLLFHKAWARGQPAVSRDRPDHDAFVRYLGALAGVSLGTYRARHAVGDAVGLHYAGLLCSSSRNADGLRAILADHFGLPTRIEEFVGEWMELPERNRWSLGTSRETGTLGKNTLAGARVWSRTHKFAIELGPLDEAELDRMLPGSEDLVSLQDIVRMYTNDEWAWELRLVLAESATLPMRLGGGGRLGWTTRIGAGSGKRIDLVVDPVQGRTRRVSRETTCPT
jgi:type VI secretion system protein ImpH